MAENKDDKSNLDSIAEKLSAMDPDIDSIEVSILIIAKHPNGQFQSKSFLNKRGWPTEVTGSISEALDFMVSKRPDVVLISFNHPHPSILKLPEVMTQTFNVITVGFVETADAVSTSLLAQAKVRHKIQGFPSGPSIQRIVRRVLSERLARHASLGGEVVAKTSDVDSGKVSSGEKISTGKYTMESSKIKRRLKDLDAELANTQGAKPLGGSSEADDRELLIQLKKALLPEDEEELDHDVSDSTDLIHEIDAEELLQQQSLLEQAVETSLRKNGNADRSKTTDRFEKSRRVAVFTVDSPSLHGYLVACPAVTPAAYAEADFLKFLKDAMSRSFKSLSVPGHLQSSFWIDIPEIDFVEWAKENALFNLKVPYRDHEVAVAYFPTQFRHPNPERLKKLPDMFGIKIEEISTDVPVNFKAYLPMPKSGKCYLYLRNGRTLQPEQKDRLNQKKIGSLCIKGVDVENFKAYMAADYFRNLIKKKAA